MVRWSARPIIIFQQLNQRLKLNIGDRMSIPDKKYYIIDGKTGDIMFYTDDNTGYPSVWETITGPDNHRYYYTETKLPEDRETRTRIYK